MTNVWADPIERIGSGRQRHLYERTSPAGSYLKRRCGTVDQSDGPMSGKLSKGDLTRMEAMDFAADPNACHRCLAAAGLDDVDIPSGGADSVEYDPFGVNSDEAEMDGVFQVEGDQDLSAPDRGDAERRPDDADPGGKTTEDTFQAAGVVIDGEPVDISDVDFELTFDESTIDDVDADAGEPVIDFLQREYSGTFTVDLDSLDEDALAGWMSMFFDVPPNLTRYLLNRPSDPEDAEDVVHHLERLVRFAQQDDDFAVMAGAKVSDAYHAVKKAAEAGDDDA